MQLCLDLFPQSPDGTPHSHRTSRVQGVRTPCLCLAAVLAMPDTNSLPLERELQAVKSCSVSSVGFLPSHDELQI
jgi:hypothetical protein